MNKDIKMLSKWLVTKEITSLLKIQKLLFFIRVEELKNKDTQNSYFENDKNFQAWIYGPVSRESFDYLQPWFNKETELDSFILSSEEVKIIDDKYGKYLDKYIMYSPNELVELSHKNLSWIKARGKFGANEICREFMKENDDFIKFID